MAIFDSIMNWVMKKRIHEVELFMKYPIDVQRDLFETLITTAERTEWGEKYDYKSIRSVKDFQERVPISNYETMYPNIERLMKGENNILWPGKIKWFAKSSGTTNAKSKFIPVSNEALEDCHYKGGKDMLSIYVNNYPGENIFAGKTLSIGGSHEINPLNKKTRYGDVSAVIMQNMPIWAHILRTPSLKTCLMEKWEDKLVAMVEETMDENVTSMAGVPTWTLVLLQKILEKAGKDHMLEVWPNLELFAHGAVAFKPYRDIFKKLIPSDKMNYLELYSASEGFFGIQDDPQLLDELLLMLDYGVFYEFIPMSEFHEEGRKAIALEEVELDTNYAIVISTNAGLWRYIIGDTVKFTSLSPYRIKITGRTKHFINAFGEELMIENAEHALTQASQVTGATILNYTGAPFYMEGGSSGGHEWVIEFEDTPDNFDKFKRVFDQELKRVNSDYEAKRQNDIALRFPIIHNAPHGTFEKWMKKRGKLGGQNKVPRMANTRDYLDSVLNLLKK